MIDLVFNFLNKNERYELFICIFSIRTCFMTKNFQFYIDTAGETTAGDVSNIYKKISSIYFTDKYHYFSYNACLVKSSKKK